MEKNSPASARDTRDMCSISESRKMPWSRKWQPTPVFSPGESHGQRSLAGYIVRGVGKNQTRLNDYVHVCAHTLLMSDAKSRRSCALRGIYMNFLHHVYDFSKI